MTKLRRAWDGAPILNKVLIGNAAVILVGALGGTFLTNLLVNVSGLFLALFYSAFGILLSLIINYHILSDALAPMDALQQTVERIDRGDMEVRAPVDEIGDPQLHELAQALNTMLERLAAHLRLLEANRAQVRQLSGQVLSAQEEERKRIARELHDDTSGSLARVLLNLEMCEEILPDGATELRERIRGTRRLAETALENVRKLIFDLRPALLDDLGLAAAVRWYVKNNLEPAGIAVQFEARGGAERAAPAVETAMFRIAQEAVNNIVRHAHAQHVWVALACQDARWSLTVQDDGCGFDVAASRSAAGGPPHWGLFGVQERVELLGGTFAIESQVGRGTTLRVQLPE